MSELQAIVEFSVELVKFVNIDLFQRGFYQVRVSHKIPSKIIHKIEVSFAESCPLPVGHSFFGPEDRSSGVGGGGCTEPTSDKGAGSGPSGGNIVFPTCIVNGSAVSKTFQILYKSEEVLLNDVISFKTHLLVEANRCVEQIQKTPFLLDLELWFTDQEFGADHHNSIECVSTRQLVLHLDVCRGLHYHLPVLFDYFHLSAITTSIHGSLITLCQPYINRTKFRPGTGLNRDHEGQTSFSSQTSNGPANYGYEMLLFGCPLSALEPVSKGNTDVLSLRMRRAQLVHWQLCSILLTAIQSLRRKVTEYVHLLPPLAQMKCQHLDVIPTFDNLSSLAQHCYQSCLQSEPKPATFDLVSYQNKTASSADQWKPEDYITTVESDMAYLCGSAIVQWQQFLKIILHSEKVAQHLAKSHHLQRIKRFSEAFFAIERPRRHLYSVCDISSSVFNEMSELLRKSQYLALLPHCDVECLALDGDAASLPIIYEEKFDAEIGSNEKTSLNKITLEESFTNLCTNAIPDAANALKRNFKDKLFTNLTRLNFGYGKLKEEYSPTFSNLNKVERRVSAPCPKSGPNHLDLNNSVTLLGFKRFDGNCEPDQNKSTNSLKARAGDTSLPITSSMHNLKSHTKKIAYSESLPDLSSKCNSFNQRLTPSNRKACTVQLPSANKGNNAIKPPFEFRDDKAKGAHESIKEEEFEGTPYFPKPPAEFSLEESESDGEDITPTMDAINSDVTPPSDSNSKSDRKGSRENEKCTILEMLKFDECLLCGEQTCACGPSSDDEAAVSLRRLSAIGSQLVSFVRAKEEFRQQTAHKAKGWNIYSDFPSLASRIPYFQCDVDLRAFSPDGLHLVICVHGLDGNSADLRLVKTYLELGLPTTNFEFLMSQRNQGETFDSFETLTDRLVQEICYHIEVYRLTPTKISFIGHSLGNIIIRAALARPEMNRWQSKLHTFLSLSGPHLGTAYNNSGLVNMGLWFMQKWKKSGSLLQLAMKDAPDPRQTYLYKLSLEPGLEYFRHILLCGSSQDHYVPIHSAHIQLCNSGLNDTSLNGIAYREMVANLLHPITSKANTKLIRYDVHHSLASSANSLIGRAAHIAVLDSELFIEKFMVVAGLKYFA